MEVIILSILVTQFAQKILTVNAQEKNLPPACDSEIYCQGELLATVQKAAIYNDSKTFVDMKLKEDESKIIERFKDFMKKFDSKPPKAQVEKFVKDNFDPEGSEFKPWNPTDWKKRPKFVDKITNSEYRSWALHLNEKWKNLGRAIKEDVETNPQLYSQIYVKYPVIVPGGRFREYYYWDSYWTIRGLLICQMEDTVKGMLRNFKDIVRKIGFIPNGGRIYYLARSQPPLYIPMVKSYLDFTGDDALLRELMESMEKEFNFWMEKRTVKVIKNNKEYTMAIYNTETKGPRPESYREDVTDAKNIIGEENKTKYYNEIKSAAESGWDFSSRWFMGENGDFHKSINMTNIKVRSIVPVDLNSILCWNANILSELNQKLGRKDKANKFKNIARKWQSNIEEVLRDEKSGIWFDYDREHKKSRKRFYPSNFAPLWTKCYNPKRKDEIAKKALKYMNSVNLKKNIGGIPSSLIDTDEQWDYPNVWPPLQHMVVIGLKETGNKEAEKEAFLWVDRWIKSAHTAFIKTGHMYEKYAADKVGVIGQGGEYETQEGFGWANAVVIEFLSLFYSEENKTSTTEAPKKGSSVKFESESFTIMLPILVLFINSPIPAFAQL